ncbi:MAG: hypothetical protein ACOC0O_05355 [Spirochaetota bacterium]
MEFIRLAAGIASAVIVVTSCAGPLDGDPNGDASGGDVPSAELAANEGEIGLVVDVRQIARRGYGPATAEIAFSGDLAPYGAEVGVDPGTTVATFATAIEDLTEDEVDAFSDGVDLTITVRDAGGATLATYSGSERVDSSNQPVVVTTALTAVYPGIALAPDVPYALQVFGTEDETDGLLLRSSGSPEPALAEPLIADEQTDSQNLQLPPTDGLFTFYFENAPGGYYITMQYGSNDPVYLTVSEPEGYGGTYPANTLNASGLTSLPADASAFEFDLEWDDDGRARLIGPGGNPITTTVVGTDPYPTLVESASSADYVPLRIVAVNVEWSVEDRGTTYSPPVTPPARLDFAYRSILRNCSSAELVETVGRSQTETVTISTSTEESLQLYSSQEESLSMTADVEVGGAFKAISASASLSTTQSYTYTTATTESTTNTWSSTTSTTEEIFRERTVTLDAFTAVEVYDAIASFDSVSMPFVKTLRVRGSYDGTDPLTGDEIVSQLLGNRFGGVVTTVGADYVDISIRGTALINNFYEVDSGVVEIDDACAGE